MPDPHPISVPGLDPAGRCLARLSSRSALLTDFRLLLESGGAQRPEAIRELVLGDNVLSRKSSSARSKLFTELKGRYLLDPSRPLFAAFLSEWAHSRSEEERSLVIYALFALNDRTVTVTSMQWLFPHLCGSRSELRIGDLETFYRSLGKGPHPEIGTWTPTTLTRVAQHYLASVRDFGLAVGGIKKTAHRPALYAAPVRMLLRGLRLAGVSPLSITSHKVFRILGIPQAEIPAALSELNRQHAIRFRQQADVVELSL